MTDAPIPHQAPVSSRSGAPAARPSGEVPFAALLDAAPDAIVVCDDQLRIVVFNRAAERLFGHAAASLAGAPLETLIPESFRTAHRSHMAAFGADHARSHAMGDRVVQGRTADGRMLPLHASVSRAEHDGRSYFVAVLRGLQETMTALERERSTLESRLANIARVVPGTMFSAEVTAEGGFRFTYLSPRISRLSGEDGTAFLLDADRVWQFVHPDDRGRMRAAIGESARQGVEWVSEFRVGSPERGWRWIEGRAAPEPRTSAASGRLTYHGFFLDVTHRRRAEDALREATQTLRHAQALAQMGSWTADLTRGTFEVSDEGARLFGWTPGTYPVEAIRGAIHPEDLEAQQAAWRRSLDTGEPYDFEHRAIVDGRLHWLRARADFERDADGRVVRAVGITQDVTAPREAEDRVKRFVAGSPTVIYAWLVERAGLRHSWTSDNLRQLTGHPAPATTDALWFMAFVHPEDRERVAAAHPVPFDLDHQVLEFRLRRADGEYVWLRDEKRLRRDDQGRPAEVFGSWTDVTSRIVLEEQFRQAQKMEAVGRLAGGIAHDFNNLLTVICGTSDLLMMDMAVADPNRPFVAEIQRAGQRAVGLTRQLLAFSRRQVLDPKTVDLNDIVGTVEKMLRRLIGEDVHLETSLSAEPVAVYVDPGQMEQVLLNLAVNARDAMPRGGTLRVETGHFEMTDAFCRAHAGSRPGYYSVLVVSDTGTGMTAAVRARLFEPFFTTKGPGRGTGLGLAMVFGVIKQSDGYVDVWSEEGQGTRFTIYLPAVARPVDEAEALPARDIASRGRETLLLVEDETSVRKLTRRALESFGYEVLEAAGGDEALTLARARHGRIALLITDVVMPGMSGAELAERLHGEFPAIRVLFVSGYIDDAIVRHGVVAGSHSFLQKPFMPAVLAGKVREILDRRP